MANKVIFLGGYARSGKTTTLEEFRKLGYPTFSTSQFLYQIADSLFIELFGISNIPRKEECESFFTTLRLNDIHVSRFAELHTIGLNDRQYSVFEELHTTRSVLTKLAENVIVPNIGRENAFIRPILESVKKVESSIVIIETLGGEEYKGFLNLLGQYNINLLGLINCERTGQRPNVDIREPLPTDLTINCNLSKFSVKDQILSLLEDIKNG
jgi:hypothetical protein